MPDNMARQGVPVNTVRARRLCDSRAAEMLSIYLFLSFFLLFLVLGENFSDLSFLFGGLLAANTLWFVLKKIRSYSLLTEDGVYIVRHGFAVLIPWRKIERVEYVYTRAIRSSSYYRIHYKPDLKDDITGTPIVLDRKRDYTFPVSKKAGEAFLDYSKVT